MAKVLRQASDGITGLELLLDETICEGRILVEKELAVRQGGVNSYLKAKQKYELLIRIASAMPVLFLEEEPDEQKEYLILDDDEESICNTYGWQTDCYVTGRYSAELQKNEMLNEVITVILDSAQAEGREKETIAFLEHMICKDEDYWKLAEGSSPILIYKGDDVCHNMLNIFAEQFGYALSCMGRRVIYFDCAENEIGQMIQYTNQHFQAVVGIQSYLFSVKMKDEIHYLHEYIYGPKYNFIFDHPVWMKQHLLQRYSDFYILTHDANYVDFIERYFQHTAILFPPAGMFFENADEKERIYDLTFVGAYGNYWNEILLIHQMERRKRFLANQFLLTMRKNPTLTAEQALEQVVKMRGIVMSDGEFLDLMYELRRVIYCVIHYYRDRVLQSVLKSGIRLDVFGDSWTNCPLSCYPNLVCHPNVTVEESLDIYRQSKLSLNIMSWHKGGFTERMANIMLAGAVLVTDDTTYLTGKYTERDVLSFQLEERDTLPDKIRLLLDRDKLRWTMAENGREKTLKYHTWEKRAQQFLAILKERKKQ